MMDELTEHIVEERHQRGRKALIASFGIGLVVLGTPPLLLAMGVNCSCLRVSSRRVAPAGRP